MTDTQNKPDKDKAAIEAAMKKVSKLLRNPKPPTVQPGKPGSWTSFAEKAEIIRMHRMGYRVGEISAFIGRPRGTVHRVIRQHCK